MVKEWVHVPEEVRTYELGWGCVDRRYAVRAECLRAVFRPRLRTESRNEGAMRMGSENEKRVAAD